MSTENKPICPSSGTVERSITKIATIEKPYLLCEDGPSIRFEVGGRRLPNSQLLTLDAVLSDSPDGRGVVVTFRHPHNPKYLVSTVVAPLKGDGTRPEVDGVWVAEEGDGDDDDEDGGET